MWKVTVLIIVHSFTFKAMTVNQGDATCGSHAYQKQKMANLVQMILIVLVIIVVIRGGEMCVRLRVKE